MTQTPINGNGITVPSVQRELELFETAIRSMPCGFSLWDKDLNLVLFNQNYLEIYQFKSEKLIRGISLRDLIAIRIEEGTLEVGDTQESYDVIRQEFLAHQDPQNPVHIIKQILGRTVKIVVACHLGVGWVVTHEDITESSIQLEEIKSRKAELELQHGRFEAAVNNMGSGLSMFDRDKKLVVCNTKYAELYELPDHLCMPGTPFDEIVEFRINSGLIHKGGINSHNVMFEKSLEADGAKATVFEMANGKSFSILHRLMSEGGWVSIHEDVTDEMENLNAARQREDELKLQNSRFDAAVGNMAHGLAMFDNNERLVICNQPYLEIYDLPEGMGVPGTLFQDILNYRQSLPNSPLIDEQTALPGKMKCLALNMGANGAPVKQVWEMKNGQHVSSTYGPTGDGGWVSTHEDVTKDREWIKAARARETELKIQNSRFDAAVGNMAQGLAMFDGERKLVICNDPYLELYNLPSEFGRPGTSFSDIMEYRQSIGTAPIAVEIDMQKTMDELVSELKIDADPTMQTWEMTNGMHVAVSYGPLEDGGWVSTHEDVTQRLKKEEHIKHLSRHDALTGLPNRAYFAEELEKAESRMTRGEQMALLCLDLDRFKEVNDTLGHGIGDEVLKQVAARLKSAVRDHELAARMGGDEFMCLIGPLEQPQQASLVAKRILAEFEKPMSVDGHQLKIGTSIGIAVAPMDGTDGATLMKNADRALYRAKDDGRGCFHFFEESMDEDIHRRQTMEEDLKSALDKQQFSLTFQPILELESNRISSCEALINWEHPKLGRLLSEEFVQVAHETGVNDRLIRWTIEQACLEATSWPSNVRLAINLTTLRVGKNGLADVLQVALDKSGLDPSRLELGISETQLEKNPASTVKILQELKALGIRVSLDEFGRNNSSLNRLKTFTFDKINLDRSFVADNSANQENREIARALIGLGRSLGITMNAVGVDKECQLDFMRDLGCHEVQGYLFSPALPSHSIGELLRTVELRAAEELGINLPSMPLDRVMDL